MHKILAIVVLSLIGFSAQAEFYISKEDKLEKYQNNKMFEVVYNDNNNIVYKFTTTPKTFFGINTKGQDIVGGYIIFSSGKLCNSSLGYKGRKNFVLLLEELDKSPIIKNITKRKWGYEDGNGYAYEDNNSDYIIDIAYTSLMDNGYLNLILKRCQ